MLRVNALSTLMVDLKPNEALASTRWDPTEPGNLRITFCGLTPPFLYPICLWDPIFLFLHPARFPDRLASQDSIISALRLEFKGDELEPGTQAHADEKLLGSIPGAQ